MIYLAYDLAQFTLLTCVLNMCSNSALHLHCIRPDVTLICFYIQNSLYSEQIAPLSILKTLALLVPSCLVKGLNLNKRSSYPTRVMARRNPSLQM